MIKLEMKLNDEQIKKDSKHTAQEIYDALDKVFSKYGFQKTLTKDGTLTYLGTGQKTDYGSFANLVLFLKNKDWFLPYAEKWLWYNSDEGINDEDYSIEDILYHYANRRSIA